MSGHAELLQQLLDMGRRMEKRLDERFIPARAASPDPLSGLRERERETGREKKEGGFRGTSKIKTA